MMLFSFLLGYHSEILAFWGCFMCFCCFWFCVVGYYTFGVEGIILVRDVKDGRRGGKHGADDK